MAYDFSDTEQGYIIDITEEVKNVEGATHTITLNNEEAGLLIAALHTAYDSWLNPPKWASQSEIDRDWGYMLAIKELMGKQLGHVNVEIPDTNIMGED